MRFYAVSALLAASLVAGCTTMDGVLDERVGGATLTLANGVPAGTAQLLGNGDQVTLVVGVTGVPAGVHGIHLHTTGACAAPAFESAGGHLNPLGRKHGANAPDGQHLGDLPNITVSAGGTGSLSAELSGTRAQVRDWLFDSDGTAIVLHAAADDYRTDPSGNSGARIACGVLRPA